MAKKPSAHSQSIPNITRFDYKNTAFQGWRVCKAWEGVSFTQYFGDRKRKASTSLREAKKALAELKASQLTLTPTRFQAWARRQGFAVKTRG